MKALKPGVWGCFFVSLWGAGVWCLVTWGIPSGAAGFAACLESQHRPSFGALNLVALLYLPLCRCFVVTYLKSFRRSGGARIFDQMRSLYLHLYVPQDPALLHMGSDFLYRCDPMGKLPALIP